MLELASSLNFFDRNPSVVIMLLSFETEVGKSAEYQNRWKNENCFELDSSKI